MMAEAEKETVQFAEMGPVVYAPPLQLPAGQLPPTELERE
jgi:hypothetical protein